MVSPDSRVTACPSSGRNSTYRPVQICGTGSVHLQARYTAETETGGRILIDAEGYRHGPAEVMERLARDETVDPSLYYFRTFMRFETADPASAWLNRIQAIGKGARANQAVKIEVFEVL